MNIDNTEDGATAGDFRDRLHRGAKLLMDTGEAATREEAYRLLRRYQFVCAVGPEVATSPTLQAALLTAVNSGRRCCLGGVRVMGCPEDAPLLTSGIAGRTTTLMEAIRSIAPDAGSTGADVAESGTPVVTFGSAERLVADLQIAGAGLAARVTFDGWCAGVAPMDGGFRLGEEREFSLTGVMAGALAVSECFQHLRGNNVMAMRRTVGMSLWRPDVGITDRDAWHVETGPEVAGIPLPGEAWMLGLGHLGQAYLWALMMLPYADPAQVRLVLQDDDALTESSVSTGLLTDPGTVGQKKTRVMAARAEERGFQTRIVERRFDERLVIGSDDPQLLLCGVDNLRARRVLETPGFAEIIEAGLGHTAEEYLAIRLHTFPATRHPQAVWPSDTDDTDGADRLLSLPAYAALRAQTRDGCGVVRVAGAAVGVPFVGAAAGALVIAEAIRAIMNGPRFEIMDMSLRDPVRRTPVGRRVASSQSVLGFALAK